VIGRVVGLIFGFVAAVILVSLAVANRHGVLMVLDPFNPQDPVVAINLPLYGYLLAMLLFGVLLGGLATWFSQGKWRRIARVRSQEALRWKAEAERLSRERDATTAPQKQLALAGR
jgi:hypothetical protein